MEEAGNLDQEARNLISEIQDQRNEIFDSWSRNILAGIRDESLRYNLETWILMLWILRILIRGILLSLSSDSPVMSFDHNKLMKINYDSRLINFVEEVRVLSSMGFKIAPKILQNSKLAEDFMQQAKDLEQVIGQWPLNWWRYVTYALTRRLLRFTITLATVCYLAWSLWCWKLPRDSLL